MTYPEPTQYREPAQYREPTQPPELTQSPELTRYQLQPGYQDLPAYGVPRDHSQATVALVLGVVAFCTGLLFLSPIAWWLGRQAVREIDATPGVYNNRGMAQAGQICGLIGTVLLGAGLLFVLVTMVFVVTI
ncbi:DUF4190 domain-containing protein [Kribbella solani]|uniref:DUF4190 domain-containing protein n=1 Tax=Kribbella solani TaxID=236067 RepID=A0A841DYZ0_9ACTN|nr:DUF4190 domain-containing protein [Kribbella solani]MBB5983783.1 hypothetical protein [Kribbella solani]